MRVSIMIASLSAFIASSSAVQAESWRQAAPMPMGVQEIYADVMDGLIYVGGGIPKDRADFTDQFLAYDAKVDKWTRLAPLPARRHHITISAAEGKIYAMGGFTGALPRWSIHRAMFVYDVKTNAWSDGVDMPSARAEHVAPVVDGKIYVIGGRVAGVPDANTFDDYVDTNNVDVFDTRTRTWSRAVDAPTARNSHAAAVIDGKIYVVGGRQNIKGSGGHVRIVNVKALEVYDPKTDRWQTKADMPLAQGGLAAAALDGKLYVFGGEQWYPDIKVFGNVWVYDPKLDRWEAGPALRFPRHGLAAATVDSEIFAFGGATRPGLGAVPINEVLRVK